MGECLLDIDGERYTGSTIQGTILLDNRVYLIG